MKRIVQHPDHGLRRGYRTVEIIGLPVPSDTEPQYRTITIRTNPSSPSLGRAVRSKVRGEGVTGKVRLLRQRPRAGSTTVRQMVDVDISIEGGD